MSKRKPTNRKCEVHTEFCRGTGTLKVQVVGKGAPAGTYWCCLACLAIVNRRRKVLKQVMT